MAQNDFHPDAWTRARNRFVEDLTDEEQVRMCHTHPLPSDIGLKGLTLGATDLPCVP